MKSEKFNFKFFVLLISCFLIISGCGSSSSDSGGTLSTPVVLSNLELQERSQILSLTNAERRKNNVPELIPDGTLDNVAQLHAKDMTSRNYFDHINKDGEDPFDRMNKQGAQYTIAGENIALQLSPGDSVTGWMNSPPHRDGLLNPQYKKIGIGVSKTGNSSWANYVQVFSD